MSVPCSDLLACDCGRVPRAYRVRVPHLTWVVICKCGYRTGYYHSGRFAAVDAWNRAQRPDATCDKCGKLLMYENFYRHDCTANTEADRS